MPPVPPSRIRICADRPVNPSGAFVLYWMTTARRTRFNFSLQRAVELSLELRRPLVVLEALRSDYPFASDRLHRFVLDGMLANARALAASTVLYHPYVEPEPGHGKGLIRALSQHACAIVTDWYPAFFLPAMLASAARQAAVRLEAVDSNGIIPVASHERAYPTALGYRAFVQRTLTLHLKDVPQEYPVAGLPGGTPRASLPDHIAKRWPAAGDILNDAPSILASLPLDHSMAPVDAAGGQDAARAALTAFMEHRLDRYSEDHNHPDLEGTSRLSPYLHFGHIASHEIFAAVMTHERWTTRKLTGGARGAREGWWHTSPAAEAYLDQLITWRELAFNGCALTPHYDRYESLPAWARATLDAHLGDPRPHIYPVRTLEAAETGDRVWNAAQRQLMTEGWFHGYLRMLWGKKILEWSAHPSVALATMAHLMSRYSIDGRDPVSYASFGWVLGRYDRPWFERPVFGTVRYMTSASAQKKLKMKRFLARYGDPPR